MKRLSLLILIMFILSSTIKSSPSYSPEISKLVQSMTLREKVGQLFIIGIKGQDITEETKMLIRDYHIGGVYLQPLENITHLRRCARLCNDLQNVAKIPLFTCVDQEGGVMQVVLSMNKGTDTVGNMALGATQSEPDTYNSYKIMAREMKAIGLNVALAPVLDTFYKDNPMNHIRCFSDDPKLIAKLAPFAVKGFQDNGVIATIKHFPGLTKTGIDHHVDMPIIESDVTDQILPFKKAIEAGADIVMTCHSLYPALDKEYPATLSYKILTKLLKEKFKFKGVVMTDSLSMGAISKYYKPDEAVIKAINAGCDALLIATTDAKDLEKRINAVIEAVKQKKIKEERINDAVTRILNIKKKYGLFANKFVDVKKIKDNVGIREYFDTSLNVARNSITLVKNKNNIIPLDKNAKLSLAVICPRAFVKDPTTSWLVPLGVTLDRVLRNYYPNIKAAQMDLTPSEDEIKKAVEVAQTADIVIIGVGHAHFSEMQRNLVSSILKLNKKVILVALSTPADLAHFINDVDAAIGVYNPRTVSLIALSEVLFGELKPKGILPIRLFDK